MAPYLQRKYTDLIRQVSSKWANWDPPIPVVVGAYGEIESETGELRVDGNIYDPKFQEELDALGIPLRMANHPPEEGGVEEDFTIASRGAKRVTAHLGPQTGVAGIANASFQGQWQFERGRRDALLIMHSPRTRSIPRDGVLKKLSQVSRLRDKWLVTTIHVCPAFSMYLSNKSGETISLALVANAPTAAVSGITASANAGLGWWSDVQADLLRKACDRAGNYSYTPLYSLKRPVGWFQRMFRDDPEMPTLDGDDLWVDVPVPWDPLNEDGEPDSVDQLSGDEDEF